MKFCLFPAALQTTLSIEWGHTHEKEDLSYGNGCVSQADGMEKCMPSIKHAPPADNKAG